MTTTTPPLAAGNRWHHLRRIGLLLLAVVIIALNGIAYMHAWAITHYAPVDTQTTRVREVDGWSAKLRLLLAGPKIRRMENKATPAQFRMSYSTITFPGSQGSMLEAWRIKGKPGRPTVLMFPGYGGSKDTLLRAASEFSTAGCETWLVDFSGIGSSEGNTTTIGWREAEDVAATVFAARDHQPGPVILYGTSMGASAILCANHRGLVQPDAVILECPFDRLTNTIGNRLNLLGVPSFPFARMITFWIGMQNGFNALAHNPVEYARSIRCPVLLMQGENDQFVGQDAAKQIAATLQDRVTFRMLPRCGHAYLVRDGEQQWKAEVRQFLAQKVPAPSKVTASRRPASEEKVF